MKCLNPTCDKDSFTRGLCHSCYQAARRLVANKETTWKSLEDSGRASKRKPHHFARGTTINWLLSANHIDELEFQETGKVTPPESCTKT